MDRPLKGSCHCGAVRFEVVLADGLRSARRCTCSICRMRGAVAVSAALDGVRILAGANKLATYGFNTHTAKHHFCSVCGIYTHHQRRSDPRQLGVNLACLEGSIPTALATDRIRPETDLDYAPAPCWMLISYPFTAIWSGRV